MLRCLLDTNVCIDLIRQRSDVILRRLRRRAVGSVGISAITYAELRHGVARSRDPERNLIALAHVCAPLELLPFDDHAAARYGAVRATLQAAGTPIGPLDTLIAAHAIALGVTLITSNTREFSRVSGLRIDDWSGD